MDIEGSEEEVGMITENMGMHRDVQERLLKAAAALCAGVL